MRTRTLPTVFVICALGACAGNPQPPEVEDVGAHGPIIRPAEDDQTTEPSSPTSAATNTLLASAREASAASNHSQAIALLERAVRISPRDAGLWIRLSQSHLDLGNTESARQHARKAISLAADDPLVTREAWLQLARVLDAEGKRDEARSIRRRYRTVRG